MKFFLVFAAASSFILYIYFCLPSTPVRHPLKKEENWSVVRILHPSILLCSRASHTLWSAVVAWQKKQTRERVAHCFWQGLLGIV